MITKPECLRRDCADDAYPLRSAMRDKLAFANISWKSSLTMKVAFTLSGMTSATCSVALRGLISVDPKFTLCVKLQGVGF